MRLLWVELRPDLRPRWHTQLTLSLSGERLDLRDDSIERLLHTPRGRGDGLHAEDRSIEVRLPLSPVVDQFERVTLVHAGAIKGRAVRRHRHQMRATIHAPLHRSSEEDQALVRALQSIALGLQTGRREEDDLCARPVHLSSVQDAADHCRYEKHSKSDVPPAPQRSQDQPRGHCHLPPLIVRRRPLRIFILRPILMLACEKPCGEHLAPRTVERVPSAHDRRFRDTRLGETRS